MTNDDTNKAEYWFCVIITIVAALVVGWIAYSIMHDFDPNHLPCQ